MVKHIQNAMEIRHLVNSDVDDAIFKHLGIKKEEEQDKTLPKICHICKMPNSYQSTICSKCGKVLDLETALKEEEQEVTNKNKIVKDVLKQLKKQAITHYQDEFFTRKQQEQMKTLADTVDGLKSEIESLKKDSPKKLEFCCVDCSTVHDKQECPACGSKTKRIYEESNNKVIKP